MHVVKEIMRLDKDDRLFPKGDKFCYSASVIQKKILVVLSEYVSRSQPMLYALDELDYVGFSMQPNVLGQRNNTRNT